MSAAARRLWSWCKRKPVELSIASVFISTANAVLVFGWFDYAWRVLVIVGLLLFISFLATVGRDLS